MPNLCGLFCFPPIWTLMHLCIMLYTFWTLLDETWDYRTIMFLFTFENEKCYLFKVCMVFASSISVATSIRTATVEISLERISPSPVWPWRRASPNANQVDTPTQVSSLPVAAFVETPMEELDTVCVSERKTRWHVGVQRHVHVAYAHGCGYTQPACTSLSTDWFFAIKRIRFFCKKNIGTGSLLINRKTLIR